MKALICSLTLSLYTLSGLAQWHPDGPPDLKNNYYIHLYADKCIDGNCKAGGTGTLRFKSYFEIQEYTGSFTHDGRFLQGKLTWKNGDTYEGSFTEKTNYKKDVFVFYDSGVYHKAGAYTYTARFVNGLPNGMTIIRFDDGGEYRGNLIDGYYDGSAFTRFQNGGTYEGSYKHGARDGKGRLEYSNGLVYDGEWSADKRAGRGMFTDKNKPGYWFSGVFANDYPNGPGKLLLPGSADTIAGEFNDGHRNGFFAIRKPGGAVSYTYFQKDSAVYTGLVGLPDARYCLSGNCQTGKGKMMDKDGNVYEGMMKGGRMEGEGSAVFKEGSKFTGTYSANQAVKGHAVFANGNEYEGSYTNGNFEGQGTYRWPDGAYYTGSWEKGFMNGKGVYAWGGNNKGKHYEGEFAEGLITGQGVLKQADGSVYAGRFDKGDFAEGTYTLSDGTVYESNNWGRAGFANGTRKHNGVTENGKFDGASFSTTAQQQADDYAYKHPWLQGTIPVARRQADMNSRTLVDMSPNITHVVRQVNLATGYYSKVTDWDMIASYNGGFKRYYIFAGAAGKKYPVPFGIRMVYEFVDANGNLIKREETGAQDGFDAYFDAPSDGKYTIQAMFDFKNCIGCQATGGARLEFTLISRDFTYKEK